jgi:hypothetical protein
MSVIWHALKYIIFSVVIGSGNNNILLYMLFTSHVVGSSIILRAARDPHGATASHISDGFVSVSVTANSCSVAVFAV